MESVRNLDYILQRFGGVAAMHNGDKTEKYIPKLKPITRCDIGISVRCVETNTIWLS